MDEKDKKEVRDKKEVKSLKADKEESASKEETKSRGKSITVKDKTRIIPKKEKIQPKQKKLIEVHRSVLVSQKCDGITNQPYFFVSTHADSFIKFPSGTISVTNTSASCKMKIMITTFSDERHSVTVGPSSSFTTTVSGLKRFDILCTGETGPNSEECTGSIEMDIVYVVVF